MTEAPVPFLEHAASHVPVLRDDAEGHWLTAGDLTGRAQMWRKRLGTAKRLTFLFMTNECRTVAALLGAMAATRCVALLSPRLPADSVASLLQAYSPDEIIAPAEHDFPGWTRGEAEDGLALWHPPHAPALPLTAPHPDVALLLSTSGSTGSPKFVRLSLASLMDNAHAIAERLDIRNGDVACGHLPLDYSYGLSVLTSHLVRGARVALTQATMMDRGFWSGMKQAGITHLPGVPFHYQMLARLRFQRLDLPHLRTMTQAGGRLELDLQEAAHAFMDAKGGRFHVMYGQTEAAPRMTTLLHEDFTAHKGSVGTALRGGQVTLVDGEIVYAGANVMMGYAQCRADLALPDQMNGVLHTGDRGHLDADGYLTITGRLGRMAKIYGLRVDLDEMEAQIRAGLDMEVALVQHGDAIRVLAQGDTAPLAAFLASRFALPAHAYQVQSVDALSRLQNGKLDYTRLAAMP